MYADTSCAFWTVVVTVRGGLEEVCVDPTFAVMMLVVILALLRR